MHFKNWRIFLCWCIYLLLGYFPNHEHGFLDNQLICEKCLEFLVIVYIFIFSSQIFFYFVSSYSFLVFDNRNLEKLFLEDQKDLSIKKGRVRIQKNRRLCPSLIVGINATDDDIDQEYNGDEMPCKYLQSLCKIHSPSKLINCNKNSYE